ncbi:MAG TPA: glycosyltransferase family 2 protein [Phycisphaerae bacterium]|nr:glycosyltransferase family 2 protein [Phycisphaerae bacterium]
MLVSVLMPVFNAGAAAGFLGDAIASVLAQEGVQWELLACDDGSTDGSGEWLEALARKDRRLRVVRQPNAGVVPALNRLLASARGRYLARMDADDVMMPQRLARQVAFLEEHPAIGVLGGWLEQIDAAGQRRGLLRYATDPGAVESGLVFRNTLGHPAVMMRREIFGLPHSPTGLRYQTRARHVEDYALWIEASARWGLANMPEVLLRYRIHENSVGARHAAQQQHASVALQLSFLRDRLGIQATPAERRLHAALAFDRLEATPEFCAAAMRWLRKLAEGNLQRIGRKGFPGDAFLRVLTGRYVAVVKKARQAQIDVEERAEPFGAYMHAAAI